MGIVSLIQGACVILSLLIDCGRSQPYPSIQWTRHNPKPGSYYTTRLGDHNRHVNEGTEEDIRAKRVIVHPHYNKIPTHSDIAIQVSQLHKPATLSAEVKTICLPSQDEVVHKSSRCFITGYEFGGTKFCIRRPDEISCQKFSVSMLSVPADSCGPSPRATGRPTPPPSTGQPSPPPPNTPPVPGSSLPGACGKGPIARIVGGMEAKRGDYPWQALLQKNGYQFCGGTLISPQWVLSAAHCVKDEKPENIIIRIGALYRVDKPSTSQGEQKFTVTKIITYESYNKPKRMSYDVALLKLESPATLDDFTNLACLPSSDPIPGTLCTITGWGYLKERGEQPEKLQVMEVPIISKETCEGYYRNELHESMLCAGLPGGGKDSCQGDSGGPMVCEGPDGRYIVHGVTSWGYGCARPGRPGVYARVFFLIKWIEDTMKNN